MERSDPYIETIIKEAADKIKKRLCREIVKIKEFPHLFVGIDNKKIQEEYEFARGIAYPKRGIILSDSGTTGSGVDYSRYVILLPEDDVGLRTFDAATFKNDKSPDGCWNKYPNWHSRREIPQTYITHGQQALAMMRRIATHPTLTQQTPADILDDYTLSPWMDLFPDD